MIKTIIISIIGIVCVSTICDMIMPEGSIKKYYKLAMGFITMCVILSPITGIKDISQYEFSFDGGMSEEELRAESDAMVLSMHKTTIINRVKEITGTKKEVFVEIYSDGRVKSISIYKPVTDEAISKIQQETGCTDIKILGD